MYRRYLEAGKSSILLFIDIVSPFTRRVLKYAHILGTVGQYIGHITIILNVVF